MNLEKLDPGAFRGLVPTLPPTTVSDFLRESGWVRADRHEGLAEYWLAPGSRMGAAASDPYLLPLDERRRDYDRRQAELLADLAGYFGDDPTQLLRRITTSHWDTLILRAHPDGPGDSVALAEAACLLNVGLEMLKISALYTDNPYRTSWGSRRSAPVVAYLRDGVRLGHTERGSFVFPVLSHLERRPETELPFGRRVMVNLAAALNRVHGWSDEDSATVREVSPFDVAIARSLKPLAQLADLSLELSFRWASAHSLPPAPSPPAPLAFDIAAARAIAARTQQGTGLTEPSGPPRWPGPALPTTLPGDSPVVEFTGRVIAIGVDDRNTQQGQSPYFIVLHAREADYFMAVSQEEHEYALRAWEDGRAVTVRGTIVTRDGRNALRGSLVRDGTSPRSQRPLGR